MVEAMKRALFLLASLAFLPLPAASAHQLDEYLQATLVAIGPGEIRLQMNLTPGVAIAKLVTGLMDRDHDGVISTDEGTAYAGSLKRDLLVRLDDREARLDLVPSKFPAPADLLTGSEIVQLEFSIAPGALAAGSHRLRIENRHLGTISVYLVNAAMPKSDRIKVVAQTRNENQSTGEIEFSVNPAR
jgi:hypothetical protein